MNCPRCGDNRFAIHQPCPGCNFMQPPVTLEAAQPTQSRSTGSLTPTSPAIRGNPVLVPEMPLQGIYILVEQLEMRQWSPDMYEAQWLAQDLQRGKTVLICEVVLPLSSSRLQQFLRSATKVLMMASNKAYTAPLLDVFLEHGRGFFVFAHSGGESLYVRIQRGEMLHEDQVIDCYQQIAEALLFLSSQHIIHGSIRPDHVVNVGSYWILTNGSVLSAGGVTQFLSQETLDRHLIHEDLYALAQVMYYAVVGTVPSPERSIQQAQVANARLSPSFRDILLKGVHPVPQQRYQHPIEIVQTLGRSIKLGKQHQERKSPLCEGKRPNQHQQILPLACQPDTHSVPSQQLARMDQHKQGVEGASILPHPEDLPPLPQVCDPCLAGIWTTGILVCATIILLIAR